MHRWRTRPWAAIGALVILAISLALYGTQHSSSPSAGGVARASARAHTGAPPHDFAWLHPGAPPPGWQRSRLPSSPAALAYPPGWRPISTDPGTASAALTGPGGVIVAYLNATPKSGKETLANWRHFRPGHVAEEGSTDVRLLASATHLAFRSGRGSCVIDSYSTSRAHYMEIACLIAGARASTVIVGAVQPSSWQAQGPAIERAIDSFTT